MVPEPFRPNGSLDKTVGSLLLGTYLNSCLLVLELFQMSHYFRRMNNDSWIMKTVVGIVGFINAIDTLATISAVYLYAITHWGNTQYLVIQNWPITAHFVATGLVGALVQAFMLYRFWRMTEHTLTVCILALFSTASFAGSIGTAVDTTVNAYFSKRGGASIFVTIWLIGSLVADVGIAVALVWRLHRVKTDIQPAKRFPVQFPPPAWVLTNTPWQPHQEINHLGHLNRHLDSIIAIIAVFAYFHEPSSNVGISVTFILGRVYSCTMLYLLNNRSKMRGEKADGTVEVGLATNFNLGGIYINRTVVVIHEFSADAFVPPPPESEIKDRPFAGLVDLNAHVSSFSSGSSTFSGDASEASDSDDDSPDSPPEATP
ncbi:hypothetical protein B0H13DRAFT_1993560 [Mycena leptocephala]|nr:hypothetical protein B0H13DRAFT_1993560 [Mycena leptocephala]